MTDTQSLTRRQMGSRLLITGAALTGAAAALGLAGLTLAAVAVVTVARNRVVRMEVPPTELAKRQWRQARAAVNAGTSAWQRESATQRVG
jgi:hypothetical protein